MKKESIDNWVKKRQEHLAGMKPEIIFKGILSKDIGALSSGITLVESHNPGHRGASNELIQKCLPHTGKSIRIGVTGVPGVGKSTFIESFGKQLLKSGKKLAVLTIDPSSGISGGSILGDKTRMDELSTLENVFIRPSAAGETLGGVERKTRESILLCEAAGFDVIIIETVGVGQSETVVKSMVDFFLLLMLSGAGDELQGIKKGIMEMADALVITKADGDNIDKANLASRQYKNALHLFPPNANNWIPKVFTCSSYSGENIDKVENVINSYVDHVKENKHFEQNRREQDKMWLSDTLKEMILSGFFADKEMLQKLKETEEKVVKGELTSFQAADQLFETYNNARGF